MILKDLKGLMIYPGQIHGLAVVPAAQTPGHYTRPRLLDAFAVVAEGQTLDSYADGGYFMAETRYVLAWFASEGEARLACGRLQERYRLSEAETAQIFEGVL